MKTVIKVLIIGLICLIISKYLISICVVHGNSMEPTLSNNKIVLENKITNKYNKNDIVVIEKNNYKIIKRIVACEYDKVIIKNGYLYVNDVKNNEIYTDNYGLLSSEIILKKDEFIVLGDNINNSIDSRSKEIGIIKKNEIKGKIII